MRFLNLSPHRSGTKSFTDFSLAHGLRALHYSEEADASLEGVSDSREIWARVRHLLPTADVASDFPWPLVHEEAARADSRLRFVVFRRQPAAWLASVRRHVDGRRMAWGERAFYARICGRREETLAAYLDGEILHGYGEFLEDLEVLLDGRLEVFDLGEAGLETRLAAWMGLEAGVPFPHVIDR